MKRKMAFLFVMVLTICSIMCCGPGKKVTKEKDFVMYGYERLMNGSQLDSLCVADTLSTNFENWIEVGFHDYETERTIVRYLFIKRANSESEVIYTVTQQDTLFNVNKRMIKTE